MTQNVWASQDDSLYREPLVKQENNKMRAIIFMKIRAVNQSVYLGVEERRKTEDTETN